MEKQGAFRLPQMAGVNSNRAKRSSKMSVHELDPRDYQEQLNHSHLQETMQPPHLLNQQAKYASAHQINIQLPVSEISARPNALENNFPTSRRASINSSIQRGHEQQELGAKSKLSFEPLHLNQFSKRIGPRVSPTNYEPMNSVKKTLLGDGNESMLQRQQEASAFKINGTNGTVTKQLDIYSSYRVPNQSERKPIWLDPKTPLKKKLTLDDFENRSIGSIGRNSQNSSDTKLKRSIGEQRTRNRLVSSQHERQESVRNVQKRHSSVEVEKPSLYNITIDVNPDEWNQHVSVRDSQSSLVITDAGDIVRKKTRRHNRQSQDKIFSGQIQLGDQPSPHKIQFIDKQINRAKFNLPNQERRLLARNLHGSLSGIQNNFFDQVRVNDQSQKVDSHTPSMLLPEELKQAQMQMMQAMNMPRDQQEKGPAEFRQLEIQNHQIDFNQPSNVMYVQPSSTQPQKTQEKKVYLHLKQTTDANHQQERSQSHRRIFDQRNPSHLQQQHLQLAGQNFDIAQSLRSRRLTEATELHKVQTTGRIGIQNQYQQPVSQRIESSDRRLPSIENNTSLQVVYEPLKPNNINFNPHGEK